MSRVYVQTEYLGEEVAVAEDRWTNGVSAMFGNIEITGTAEDIILLAERLKTGAEAVKITKQERRERLGLTP